MKITPKDVAHVALLSRLEIPENQVEKFTQELNSILEHAEELNKINTDNVQPTAHVLPLKNVMREDIVKPSLSRDLALSNAPEEQDGFFKVPKIVEG